MISRIQDVQIQDGRQIQDDCPLLKKKLISQPVFNRFGSKFACTSSWPGLMDIQNPKWTNPKWLPNQRWLPPLQIKRLSQPVFNGFGSKFACTTFRSNGYQESKRDKSKMAAKSKMGSPSSNPNISASFQPIWIKICMHHLLARPNGYPESKMAKSRMAAKSKMAAPSSNKKTNILASFQRIWIKINAHHL